MTTDDQIRAEQQKTHVTLLDQTLTAICKQNDVPKARAEYLAKELKATTDRTTIDAKGIVQFIRKDGTHEPLAERAERKLGKSLAWLKRGDTAPAAPQDISAEAQQALTSASAQQTLVKKYGETAARQALEAQGGRLGQVSRAPAAQNNAPQANTNPWLRTLPNGQKNPRFNLAEQARIHKSNPKLAASLAKSAGMKPPM